MKHLTNMLFCILLCLAGSACTSSTSIEPQNTLRNSGAARINFIRPSTLIGAFQSMRVTLNGTKLGNLGVGTHFYVDRPPGTYNVTIETEYDLGKWEQTIDVPYAKDYYFKIVPGSLSISSVGTTASVNGRMNVIAISEDEGKSLIEASKD